MLLQPADFCCCHAQGTGAPSGSTQPACPNDSNLPVQCSPSFGYTYTCYAKLNIPFDVNAAYPMTGYDPVKGIL